MRSLLGVMFLLIFVGFVGCSLMLGGTVSEVYEWRYLLLAGALLCAFLSTLTLGLLAFGVGAKGRRRSTWRVPVLCGLTLLLSLSLASFIFLEMPDGRTPQGEELNLYLGFCAVVMIGFALVSLIGLIASIIATKKHNSKLTNQLHQMNPSLG